MAADEKRRPFDHHAAKWKKSGLAGLMPQSFLYLPHSAALSLSSISIFVEKLNSSNFKSKQMNPVIHFEMPAADRARMVKFYESAFGWKTQQLGEEMGNYVVVSTTETDNMNRPTKPGAINGGFFQKSNDNQYPSVVIAVDDIREGIKKVKAAGGKVIGGHLNNGEPDEIPGVGLYASFIDSEGNRVSMLQPMGM